MVLGSDSEILDVGARVRLVTPAIRLALTHRDGGCVFPGCEKSDAEVEAHHIIPWWAGGPTALNNLVLLCPHHHGLVEPPRFWPADDDNHWEVRLDEQGYPLLIPPVSQDPERSPLRNRRAPAGAAA